jgi:translation initiation factor 4B
LPSLVCPFSSIIWPLVSHEHSAKERAGFGGLEDPKFSGEWRRQGPLPDLGSRDSSGRRYDGPAADRQSAPNSVSDTSRDWRSNRPSRPAPAPESEAPRRKNSAFVGAEGAGAADKEETWTIGGKFKPSEDDGPGRKFGSHKGRGDMGPPSSVPPESPVDNDWRSGPRAGLSSHSSTSRKFIILPFRTIIHLRP